MSNPAPTTGLRAVLALKGFRQLWIGQIFSQLADKFYIVLMVYLIAQTWVSTTPEANPALAEMELVRLSRLSVAELTQSEWREVLRMAGE